MRVDVLTLFPEMLSGFLDQSMMKRAVSKEAVSFNIINPRDFSVDVHHTTDDRPYGGGPGMVMKPEPLFAAIESVKTPESRIIYLSPQGHPFCQSTAARLKEEKHLIFICGHYEGIDERIIETLVDEEISIGDYVLTNGALAAAVVIDATVRLIPGVVGGGEAATEAESFTQDMFDHPHYTRPEEFQGMRVPEVLLSGNHAAINAWRKEKAEEKTKKIRPDLI